MPHTPQFHYRVLVLLIILVGLTTGYITANAAACGSQRFNATTNYSVGSNARSMALGDFDGDSNLDIVLAHHGADYISISINDGNGGYTVPVSYPVKSGPNFVVTGDFNTDGKLDIATVGYSNSFGDTAGFVSVLLGDGTGGFGRITSYSVGTGPKFMAAADLNKDNHLDLVTANSTSSNLSVLFGNGTGSFQPAVNYTTASYPRTVAISDFNKDGNLDMVSGHYSRNTLTLFLGTGSGSFGSGTLIALDPSVSSAENVAVGDFNGDGNTDLAVVITGGFPRGVSVLLGDGAGGFSSATFASVSFYPGYVVVGDLNGDGKQDLVVSNGEIALGGVSIFFGNGSGGFTAEAVLMVGNYPTHAAIGDLNKDGKNDLAVTNSGSSDFTILLGNGMGKLGTISYPEGGTQPTYAVTADFNGDNKSDVAVANAFSSNVSVLLGDGTGGLGAATTFAVGFQPESIATGDFNGDNKVDLAVGNFSNGQFSTVSILLGNGAGGFGAVTNYPLGSQSQTQSVATGDLNSDGKLDLVTANSGSSTVTILIGNGAGGFGAPTVIPIGAAPTFVALSDFNADGKLDLAIANGDSSAASGRVSILLGTGSGTFGSASNFAVGTHPIFITVADINGDSKLDLATANNNSNSGTNPVSILLGTGTGGFSPVLNFGSGRATSLAPSDFNGDGKLDLAVANSGFSSGPVSVYLGDGTGSFGWRKTYLAGSTPLSVVANDFNLDGNPDLAVANYSSGTVSVMLNDCQPTAAQPPTLSVNNAIVTEGDSATRNVVFTVTLSEAITTPVTVDFATLGDSAVPVADFQTLQGQLTFAPGETTKSITVLVAGERMWEQDEYFLVNLSNAVNATLKRQQGFGTILNNDPVPAISFNDAGIIEGNSGTTQMNFTVLLTNPSSVEVTMQYDTLEGTASRNIDFGHVSGSLSIASGNTSYIVSVPIYGDTLDEFQETLILSLSNASGATFLKSQGTGYIHNDDPLPSIRINDVSVAEGNNGKSNATFSVNLSAVSGKTITVSYSTANGTATSGSDYQQASGTLTFIPGETSKTATVEVNGDVTAEASESFFVNLTTPTNASIADAQGIGTITDDDTTTLQFSLTSYSVGEGQNFAFITVTRSGDASSGVTVKYQSSDLTDVHFRCDPNTTGQLTGSASRKCDYHIASGRLRFAPGETSRQIILSVVDDVYVEGAETLTLMLSDPTGAPLGQNTSTTVSIVDNDLAGAANPIDGTRFFVRQLYVDLLAREPDQAGWDGWTGIIDFCGQPGHTPPPCDRVTAGGDGFLRSAEFFDRQFFVLRLYRTGLGRILDYNEVGDLAYVSGFLSDQHLQLNKQELVLDIMSRQEFSDRYNTLNNGSYVDSLIQTAGVTLPQTDRDGWVASLDDNSKSRAQVFREISERQEVSSKYLTEAQVVSAYYGFFTRNPDGAYLTFLDWLNRGEIDLGGLANAFINSAEYRQRFGN